MLVESSLTRGIETCLTTRGSTESAHDRKTHRHDLRHRTQERGAQIVMSSADGSRNVVFVTGVAVGACVAIFVGRYALAPRRQWSWREWRTWRAMTLGASPPTTPTKQAYTIGHSDSAPFGSARPGKHSGHANGGMVAGSAMVSLPLGPAVLAPQQDEIINEQFTRNAQFFGEEGQMRIHSALVVVVGLGGVGSHAATMLLRSGVGRLRIVDFDQVSLSSLNRHAVADRADVGIPKAVCLRNHLKRIFPEASVDARVSMFEAATEEQHLSGRPDFVLDCIDNIETKVALLAACVRRGIPVLSAMGAGMRADPTRIRIADISESAVDPLSRSVRHRLRREHKIEAGIPVVFSTEEPKAKPMPFQGPNPSDYQIVPGFRIRVLPVLGTLPAMFGQAMATHVLTQLAGMHVRGEAILRLHVEHYGLLHTRLAEREEVRFGSSDAVEVDVEEVAYVARDLWRGRSAREQVARDPGKGMWKSMTNMTLTRWDDSQPPSISNLILLTFDEADAHEASSLAEIQEREPEYHRMVTAVLTQTHYDFYGN